MIKYGVEQLDVPEETVQTEEELVAVGKSPPKKEAKDEAVSAPPGKENGIAQ